MQKFPQKQLCKGWKQLSTIGANLTDSFSFVSIDPSSEEEKEGMKLREEIAFKRSAEKAKNSQHKSSPPAGLELATELATVYLFLERKAFMGTKTSSMAVFMAGCFA